MNRAPAFQEYADAVLADSEPSLAEHGALRILRAHAWREGSIPNDEQRLARLLRVSESEVATLLPIIQARTEMGANGRRVFRDLERQRQEHDEYRAKQKKKADGRWERERAKHAAAHAVASTTAVPQHMPGECSVNSDLCTLISDLQTANLEPEKSLAPDGAAHVSEPGSFKLEQPAKKQKKSKREPLPYSFDDAIAELRKLAGDKIVIASHITEKQKIPIYALIHRHALADFALVGRYVGAGEHYTTRKDGRPVTLSLLISKFDETVAEARAWHEGGRRASSRNGQAIDYAPVSQDESEDQTEKL